MTTHPLRLGGTLCLLLAVGALAHASVDQGLVLERELVMFGTQVRIQVAADDSGSALAASEVMVAALERADEMLSTWREDTELARVNRAPAGVAQPIGDDLYRWLEAARLCHDATSGAFDPAVGALVDLWGLREERPRRARPLQGGMRHDGASVAAELVSAGQGGGRPTTRQLRLAAETTGPQTWRLGPGRAVTRLRPRVRLEEGGFGKGAALDAAVAAGRAMPGVRGGLIDLGGQVGVWGEELGGGAVGEPRAERVLLADPRDRDRPVVAVPLAWGSLATSGNGVRGIVVDGRSVGHLLDPRTGEPVTDFGSLTVWAPEGLWADCLSTGLYVLGPEIALAWAARHADVEVLVLEPRGDGVIARASGGLVDRLQPLVPDLTVARERHGRDFSSSAVGARGTKGADLRIDTGSDPIREN